MRFRIELAVESERDFELIFDHLVASYRSFGESVEEALDHRRGASAPFDDRPSA